MLDILDELGPICSETELNRIKDLLHHLNLWFSEDPDMIFSIRTPFAYPALGSRVVDTSAIQFGSNNTTAVATPLGLLNALMPEGYAIAAQYEKAEDGDFGQPLGFILVRVRYTDE